MWYLEEETGSLDSPQALFFYNFALGGVGKGIGNVRVMNLFTFDDAGNRVNAQSQLVMVPGPGAAAGLGLLGLFAGRRRGR